MRTRAVTVTVQPDECRAMQRAVLVGAGHAHLYTLKRAEQFVRRGFEIVLVAPDVFWYSGLATGVLGGIYEPALDRVDTGRWIERAGGRWLQDSATALDPADHCVELASGGRLRYDVLSLDVGSEVASIPGSGERVVNIKPLANLARLRGAIEGATGPIRVVVAGAGPSGCEIAANVRALMGRRGLRGEVTLLCAGAEPLPHARATVRAKLAAFLRGVGVEIRAHAPVASVAGNRLLIRNGGEIPFDFAVNATGLEPPPILRRSGMPVDTEGALVVNHFLQSTGSESVFGGGDCVTMQRRPLDKVGVYAIRQAPVLFRNLIAFLAGKPLTTFRPQKRYLLILNLGDGSGLATWGGWHWRSRWAFRWKNHLDRRFLAKYRIA